MSLGLSPRYWDGRVAKACIINLNLGNKIAAEFMHSFSTSCTVTPMLHGHNTSPLVHLQHRIAPDQL